MIPPSKRSRGESGEMSGLVVEEERGLVRDEAGGLYEKEVFIAWKRDFRY